MPSSNKERFDKNILVVVENPRADKKAIIDSVLDKFTSSGITVLAPVEHTSKFVRDYCKKNDLYYSEITVDQITEFLLNLSFGIMFFEGPNESSYSNKYRIGMNALEKMCLVVEVNSG